MTLPPSSDNCGTTVITLVSIMAFVGFFLFLLYDAGVENKKTLPMRTSRYCLDWHLEQMVECPVKRVYIANAVSKTTHKVHCAIGMASVDRAERNREYTNVVPSNVQHNIAKQIAHGMRPTVQDVERQLMPHVQNLTTNSRQELMRRFSIILKQTTC